MTVASQPALSRAEINRINAQKSTGPRSVAGKQRVKFNALKHGMRARTIVLPGEHADAFNARHDAWTIALDPRDDVDRYLVTRAVEVSWKLDRVRWALRARREADRLADADRLAAQAEEVVALGRRLFFDPVGPLCLYPHDAPAPGGEVPRISWSANADDPDDPARMVVRLEALALGCAWLLERWGELRDVLECGLMWQPHDRLKAVRMLGRQPLEALDDRRAMRVYLCCWYMDPDDGYEFSDVSNELSPSERSAFIRRLNARDGTVAVPQEAAGARATLLALIGEEEERLEGLLAQHLEREEAEAEAALAFEAGVDGERLRKYELSNDRTLLRIVETLRKRHRETDGAGPPAGQAAARVGADSPRTVGDDASVSAGLTAEEIQARPERIAPSSDGSPANRDDIVANAPAAIPGPEPEQAVTPVTEVSPLPDRGDPARWSPPACTSEAAEPTFDSPLREANHAEAPAQAGAGWLAALPAVVLALFALLLGAGRFAVATTSARVNHRDPAPVQYDGNGFAGYDRLRSAAGIGWLARPAPHGRLDLGTAATRT